MNGLKPEACLGGVTLLGTQSGSVRGAVGLAAGHPWRTAFDGAVSRGKPLWQHRNQLHTQIASSCGDPDQTGQFLAAEQELAQLQAALQPIEMEAAQYNAWADELCKDD